MRIGEACKREVVTASPSATLSDIAKLMRGKHVGSVVIIDGVGRAVGIVTDRDIVVETVACDLDPRTLTAGELMNGTMICVNPEVDTTWALKVMRDRGVRRLPVVDNDGTLYGIIALDDLLEAAAGSLQDVVQTIGTERLIESVKRKAA